MNHRWQLNWTDFLGVVFTLGLFGSRGSLLGDPGVGWHLRAGEWMQRHREVVRVDPFLLWPSAAPAWVHDQWGSDLLLWNVYLFGGFPALHLLVAIVSIAAFVLVLRPLFEQEARTAVGLLLPVTLAMVICSIQWFLRPVIFSFLLFAFTYRFAAWLRHKKEDPLWPLVLYCFVFILWSNLHPAFWLGLAVYWVLLFDLFLDRRISFPLVVVLSLVALCATALNPWGIELWRSTLSLATDSYFTKLNMEWLPPDYADSAFWPFVLASLLLVWGCLRKEQSRISRFELLVLFPLLCLSVLHRRYLPFFALASVVPLTKSMPQLGSFPLRKTSLWLTPLLWSGMLVSIVMFGRIPFFANHTSGFPRGLPEQALLEIQKAPAPVFHSPDLGGYLLWTANGSLRPFIDDRNQLIGRQRYEEYFSVLRAEEGWSRILEKWSIGWILINPETPLGKIIEGLPAWKRVPLPETQDYVLLRHINLPSQSSP